MSLSKSTNAEKLEEAEQEAGANSEVSATPAQLNLIQQGNPKEPHMSAKNLAKVSSRKTKLRTHKKDLIERAQRQERGKREKDVSDTQAQLNLI